MNLSIPDALRLALQQQQAGQFEQADAILAQILQVQPEQADALHIAGLIALRRGDAARAQELIARSLRQQASTTAWSNLGAAWLALRQPEQAVAAFRAALQLEPGNPYARQQPAQTLAGQGAHAEAVSEFETLLATRPDAVELHAACALSLQLLARFDDAIAHYRRALELKPELADLWNNLGMALIHRHDVPGAEAAFRRALALQPDSVLAAGNLGRALMMQRRYAEAEPLLRAALAGGTPEPMAWADRVSALAALGRMPEAGQLARETLQRFPQAALIHSPLLATLACDDRCTPEEYLAAARVFGAAATAQAQAYRDWRVEPRGSDVPCLRVGLVSGDLRDHAVAYFLESFLARIDPARLQLVAWKTFPDEDAVTARLRQHIGEWHDISALGDAQAAARIRDAGIHILIDLSGHTAWNRLTMFAWRPAPVQLSWLGYSASTGLPAIDWLLADDVTVPAAARDLYSERCWYLPESRVCFTPAADAPPVAPLPAASATGVTFGSFQMNTKINDRMLALWARVLHAVPGSRFRLQNGEMSQAAVRDTFVQRMAALGIARERLLLAGRMPRAEYLAVHAEVDFILDTFPYPGGTTTCDALWMGVPTLTLAGRTLLSRYGAGVLTTVGLPDWVANDDEDFVQRAVRFAEDRAALATLRSGLRERMRVSALCDAERFAGRFTDALHGMWRA